ncbi:MAG: hypothetical protein ABR887_02625 [Methanoregulaceae archaeon]|jgi:hypothetical protein
MKYIAHISIFLLLIVILLTTGCIGGNNQTTPTPTTPPTPVQTLTVSTTTIPTTTGASIKPGPTDTLTPSMNVDISVEKAGTYSTTIITKFNGGKGLGFVSKVDVRVTRPDGTVVTGVLIPEVGQTIELEGTNGTDRIEVIVTMKNGNVYKLIDQQLPYKTLR